MSAPPLPGRLGPDLLLALRKIQTLERFPAGATIFRQGGEVLGVYLVERGEVRVLLPAPHSPWQLLEVVGPGTMLGLSESMSGETYRITAEAGVASTLAFIPQQVFLQFLRDHGGYCMQIVRLLSEDLHALYHKFRSISAHSGRPRNRPLEEQLN